MEEKFIKDSYHTCAIPPRRLLRRKQELLQKKCLYTIKVITIRMHYKHTLHHSFILKWKKTNLYFLSDLLNSAIKISNSFPSRPIVTEYNYLFRIYYYKLDSTSIKFFFHNMYFPANRRTDSK